MPPLRSAAIQKLGATFFIDPMIFMQRVTLLQFVIMFFSKHKSSDSYIPCLFFEYEDQSSVIKKQCRIVGNIIANQESIMLSLIFD